MPLNCRWKYEQFKGQNPTLENVVTTTLMIINDLKQLVPFLLRLLRLSEDASLIGSGGQLDD